MTYEELLENYSEARKVDKKKEKKSHQNISRLYGRNRRKSQRRNHGPIRNRKAEPGRYGRTIRTAKGNI